MQSKMHARGIKLESVGTSWIATMWSFGRESGGVVARRIAWKTRRTSRRRECDLYSIIDDSLSKRYVGIIMSKTQ